MLTTNRLSIVPLEEEHLEPLRKMRNDPTTWHWLSSVDPISSFQEKEWFINLQHDKSRMYLAIEQEKFNPARMGVGEINKQFIGILRSDEWDRTNRSVRVGVDIAPEFRGKGYGTEALGAFIKYLFLDQNMHRIWLLVCSDNEVGIKLYKKLGFTYEGKQRKAIFRDGTYHDYLSFSLLETQWKKKST